jgi:hypothetical protein
MFQNKALINIYEIQNKFRYILNKSFPFLSISYQRSSYITVVVVAERDSYLVEARFGSILEQILTEFGQQRRKKTYGNKCTPPPFFSTLDYIL